MTRGRWLRALEHLPERRHQAEQIDFDLRLRRLADDVGDAAVGPAPLRAALNLAFVQQLGGRLELLVLEQPPHERLARILFRIVLRRDRAAAGACAT